MYSNTIVIFNVINKSFLSLEDPNVFNGIIQSQFPLTPIILLEFPKFCSKLNNSFL